MGSLHCKNKMPIINLQTSSDDSSPNTFCTHNHGKIRFKVYKLCPQIKLLAEFTAFTHQQWKQSIVYPQ